MVEAEERKFDHACSEARRNRSRDRAFCGRIERPQEKAHRTRGIIESQIEPVVPLHLILQAVKSVHNGAASISFPSTVRADRVRKPRLSSIVQAYGALVQGVIGQPLWK